MEHFIERPDMRILCFDSGIGGLPYLKRLRQSILAAQGRAVSYDVQWLYLADNAYFPFGEKDCDELRERICQIITQALRRYPAELTVLLCNTATVLALNDLRQRLPQQQFVGTVPATKPAAAASQRRRIAMLASRSTSRADYVARLHRQFASDCQLTAINAAQLIRFIEEDWPEMLQDSQPDASATQTAAIRAAIEPFVLPVLESGADQIVLGCTHFLHLKTHLQKQLQAADPELRLCDSMAGVSQRLVQLFQQARQRSPAASPKTIACRQNSGDRLLLSNDKDLRRWQFWAYQYDLGIEFLA